MAEKLNPTPLFFSLLILKVLFLGLSDRNVTFTLIKPDSICLCQNGKVT